MKLLSAYKEKLMSAEEAVKVVRSGDWIEFGYCATTVDSIDRALAARYEELSEVKVRGGVLLKPLEIMSVPNVRDHFIWHSWHASSIDRRLIDQGAAYYIPMRYSEMPGFYRNYLPPIRAAFLQVAPMDEDGYFNLGLSAAHNEALFEKAEHIFVEVNTNMPVCLGTGNVIHISRVAGVIEGDNPPIAEQPSAAPSDVDKAVARLIVGEIPNGACLQLGIGGMPNAVGTMIAESDLRDLGMHSEMFVDAFVDLARAGKLSGVKKKFNNGKQVYTFAAGTKKLYDYLDNNPQCMAAQVDYTNDLQIIAGLDNFISINNAVSVDLFGQVCSESAGKRHISGAGGQLDFVMGAYLSKGGKSFICCSSTVRDKDNNLKSRIYPLITDGSVVTDTRANTHWLVTEYGKVCLKGCSTWERAERIISIAHPDFREDLIAQAEELKIWRRSNKIAI